MKLKVQPNPDEIKFQTMAQATVANGFLATQAKAPEPVLVVPDAHLSPIPASAPPPVKASSPGSDVKGEAASIAASASQAAKPTSSPHGKGKVEAVKDVFSAAPDTKASLTSTVASSQAKTDEKPEAPSKKAEEKKPEIAEKKVDEKKPTVAEKKAEDSKPTEQKKPEAAERKPETTEKTVTQPEIKAEFKSAAVVPLTPSAPPSSEARRETVVATEVKAPLSRLQAERAMAKDSSVLFMRPEKKNAKATAEQVLYSSERKSAEAVATGHTVGKEPIRKSGNLDRNRVVWLKEKGLIAPGKGDFRTQVLNAEERVVHKALVNLVPKAVQLSSVHIATGSSKVHAQVERRRGEKLDARALQKLRQDFERQTGRQLVLERPASAVERPAPASAKPPTPNIPPVATRPQVKTPSSIPPSADSPRAAATSESKPTPAPNPAKPNPTPKVRYVSYAVAGAESAGAAAAAAAHGAAVLALNPLVVIDPKIGILEATNAIENRWSPTSNTGGSSRTRFYQPPPQGEGEDEIDPRAQQQTEENQKSTGATTEGKGKGKGHAGHEAAERLVHAERLGLEEASDNPDQGQREQGRGRSNCRCCGTELPESQRDACPICAQSGPDVIATASVNYRFAGSKFLAAADSVAASSQARGVLEQGLAESVVSLRYKPKIPGHKDFLRFRATP